MREPLKIDRTLTQRRNGHLQAIRVTESAQLNNPPLWAMCVAAALLAGFVGIAAGFFWLIVTHAPKALGRLGF